MVTEQNSRRRQGGVGRVLQGWGAMGGAPPTERGFPRGYPAAVAPVVADHQTHDPGQ